MTGRYMVIINDEQKEVIEVLGVWDDKKMAEDMYKWWVQHVPQSTFYFVAEIDKTDSREG